MPRYTSVLACVCLLMSSVALAGPEQEAALRQERDAALEQVAATKQAMAAAQATIQQQQAQIAELRDILAALQRQVEDLSGRPKTPGRGIQDPVVIDPNTVISVTRPTPIGTVLETDAGGAATISLGSDAGVRAGTRFIVSDEPGNFLAELTITDVQPDKATGKLAGPRVGDVKKGMKVASPQ